MTREQEKDPRKQLTYRLDAAICRFRLSQVCYTFGIVLICAGGYLSVLTLRQLQDTSAQSETNVMPLADQARQQALHQPLIVYDLRAF